MWPFAAWGQLVTITALVTDPNGVPYANGTARAILVDSSGRDLSNTLVNVNGASIVLSPQSKGLSGAGAMNFSLYPNAQISYTSTTQWKFSICSVIPIVNPSTLTPPQTCFAVSTTITGAADISAILKAAAPVLAAITGGGLQFPDNSVQFTASQNGGSVSGQANGVIPLATAASAIAAQSHLSDNGTSVTSTEPIVLSSDKPTGSQAASANAAVTTYNVSAFGGKPDEASFTGTFSSGSNVLTTSSPTFVSTDVGKGMVFFSTTQPFSNTVMTAFITSVTDSQHVVMSRTAANNGNAGIDYGTDNTVAANACAQYAIRTTGAGTCHFTAGKWLFVSTPYYLASDRNGAQFTAFDDGGYQGNVQPPLGGSGGAGTTTLGTGAQTGQVVSASVSSAGTLYKANATIPVTPVGGCPSGVNFQACGAPYVTAQTNSSGQVTGFTVVNPGFGLTSPPTLTVGNLNGDGAAATATLTGSTMNLPTMTAGGDGYGANGGGHNLDWFAINSATNTPCTSVLPANAPVPQVVGKGNVAIDATGHATGIVTMTNTPTGCSSAPTIIFGDVACNSGTLASPVWGQCSNMTPLNPSTVPVHVLMVPQVNWTGESGTASNATLLIGAWDLKTVDNNQPVLFGGSINHTDISGLTFTNAFIGLVATNNFNTGKIYNITAFSNGIDIWMAAQDLGGIMDGVNLNSYATIVVGGTWEHRVDWPLGAGGFFNGQEMNNFVARPTTYNATAAAIDVWFDQNIWRSDFSANSPVVYPDGCSSPLTVNQRQTSHSLSIPQPGSLFCYAGITSSGITMLGRDGRAGGATQMYNWAIKGAKRHAYYGYMNSFDINQFSCDEPCGGGVASDPYAILSNGQNSGLVFDDGGARLFNIGAGATYSTLWSTPAQGDPTNTAWNNLTSFGTHFQPVFSPNWANGFDIPNGSATLPGLTMGKGWSGNGQIPSVGFWGRSGGSTNLLGAVWTWDTNGIREIANDGTTVLNEFTTSGAILNEPVTSAYITPKVVYSAGGIALPTCTSGLKGTRTVVSDATAPTYLGNYASGGAVVAPVMCNGSTWVTY